MHVTFKTFCFELIQGHIRSNWTKKQILIVSKNSPTERIKKSHFNRMRKNDVFRSQFFKNLGSASQAKIRIKKIKNNNIFKTFLKFVNTFSEIICCFAGIKAFVVNCEVIDFQIFAVWSYFDSWRISCDRACILFMVRVNFLTTDLC